MNQEHRIEKLETEVEALKEDICSLKSLLIDDIRETNKQLSENIKIGEEILIRSEK